MNAIRLITEVKSETLSVPNMGQFIGRRVELIIVPLDDERDDFTVLTLSGLEKAYTADEPEYTASDLREKNPNYGKR